MGKAAEIDIVSVSKIYGATTAVDTISLKIPAGTYCCLLGPSGCGKTSTLRMIAGHESNLERRYPSRQHGRHRPAAGQARHGDDVPVLCAVPASRPRRQCRLQPEDEGRRQRAAPRQGARHAQADADGRLRNAPPGPAFRRPATARRARPRADHRSGSAAARRAAIGARPIPQDPHACGTEEAADSISASPSCTSPTARKRRWRSPI